MSAALNGDSPKIGGKGGIAQLRSHLQLLAQSDPEAIRKEIIAQGREPFIRGIVDTLKETSRYCYSCHRGGKERWAFRLYAELAKLVGASTEIAIQVVNLVGAPAPVARAAVESMERVKSATDEDVARASFAALDAYCEARGMTLDEARASLSVHTNGNGS